MLHRPLSILVFLASIAAVPTLRGSEELFEKNIRPVFQRCVKCHGESVQKGGVRLDKRQFVKAKRLQRLAAGKSKAPAVCQLKPRQARDFTSWLAAGMPWPNSADVKPIQRATVGSHWAFRPVRRPPVPNIPANGNVANPIDSFVIQRLLKAGLQPSPPALRRTLIRRLYYSVTGLPPSPDAVARFVKDDHPHAYERLVDQLLTSPQYGEHWARHWLDVARYSDTKGYVYGREERFWAHAWAYRDWVVAALNRDLRYDRFISLQLAADQLVDKPSSRDLAAMGFLTLGRRFQGIENDIIDDRIDVVSRGTMALTVSCARCHDHMYDPIPTADYYSFYGIFASSQEELVSIGNSKVGGADFQRELKKKRQVVKTTFESLRKQASQRSRDRVADYLFAQTEIEKYPASDFDQIFSKTDLLPGFVHRWADYLRKADARQDPIFVPWLAYARLPRDDFAQRAARLSFSQANVHPLVLRHFRTPPKSMRDVADRYGRIFADADKPGAEALRRVLFGPRSVAEVPNLPIVHSQQFFDTDSITRLYRLEGDVARFILKSGVEAPQALILRDRRVPITPRVFTRGNPLNRGDEVPRRFLAVLTGKDRRPFRKGSGRLELAQAITDPTNPLTARVIVNRVWGHHFGRGLVDTPSDFGLRSRPPSHPDLLDWLTSRFIADGWSLKRLHRVILLSQTFRQSSRGPVNKAALRRAVALDPGNRLLWRMNVRRLTWEQFRDSTLAASNDLQFRLGGKPVNLFAPPFPQRRTLYGLIDRQFLPDLLRTFDFANPDLHIPKRSQTTVPQQALYIMNDPMIISRAKAIAAYARRSADSRTEQIRTLFRRVWQREPTEIEVSEAQALLSRAEENKPAARRPTASDWQYGYGWYNGKSQRVMEFKKLPHFTGSAWQGGPKWPDRRLGWLQLTATGGHPGNTRKFAAVRRWTAPGDMSITLQSRLIHEPSVGDGIRAFIVSSRSGLIKKAIVHRQTKDMSIKTAHVKAGETVDFVVDIRDGLNSDQYLWSARISGRNDAGSVTTWDAQTDYTKSTRAQLTAWEQLAQALLCSNEFLFID